jgi:hypothetical protein
MMTSDLRERIRLIADGIPLILNNITIRTTDSGKLLVIWWTETVHFENITKAQVLRELKDLKLSYVQLTESYPELIDIIENNNLIVEYNIFYNDGGKAGVGLCSEIEGQINWYH